MREAIHLLRKAIIGRLTGQITLGALILPVYNRVPSNAPDFYIKVYSVDTVEVDQNNTSYAMETTTRIEVVTKFKADDGGELDSNIAMSQVMELVRTRTPNYFDLSLDGFKVYTSVIGMVAYRTEDLKDYTYFRAILDLENRIEQLPNGMARN